MPVPAAPAPVALTFAAALAWHPHWEIIARLGGNVTCLCFRCGLWGTRRFPHKLATSACSFNAVDVLKGAAKAALLAGALDLALHRAPVGTRDRTIFLGWTPVALGMGPA